MKKFKKISVTSIGGAAPKLVSFTNEEIDRWAKVISAANIKVEGSGILGGQHSAQLIHSKRD